MTDVDQFVSTGVFNDALAISGSMPLQWRPGVAIDAAGSVAIDAANVKILSAEEAFEDTPVLEALKDESPQLAVELLRIESKLNMLLKMTGELLAREMRVPEPRLVRLSASAVECLADPSIKVGDRGQLALYVHRSLPEPLLLSAVVESEHQDALGRWAFLRFERVSESVANLLERMIFRRHRRLIALSRHA